MTVKSLKSVVVSVFALTAVTAFADAQSDLENKIASEVAGKYRAITARANSLDGTWMARQAEKAAAAKDSSVGKDIVFLGDDAMAGWETTGADAMSAFGSAKIFNLGYKGDCTEHVLWRVTEGGELSGYTAKAVVFTVGANNSAVYMRAEEAPVATLYAIIHTLAKIRAAQPNATIIVNSILPRGANASDDVRRRIGVLNEDLRKWVVEKGSGYVWCDLTDTFVDKANGDALKTQYFENDKVTLNASGYAAWAAVLDDYVAAAANGTAMPANLVCERRPLQGSAPDSTYGTSRTYPGLGYWDKLANFLYGNGVKHEADVVLLGDSITEKWAGPEMSSSMYGLADKVMNLGNSGDMTENLLWRLENGELEGYTTKIFNLLIGTNNTQEKNPLDSPENIAAGVRKVIDLVLEKHPESKITLVPILPFGHVSKPEWGQMLDATNQAANAIIRTFADNQRVFLVDIDNSKFYNQDGTFNAQMYVGDEAALHYLHLSAKGYSEIVAPAVKAAIAAAGETGVVFPSVGSVSAAVSGTTATLTVSDIAKGTTKSGVAASSATVFCKLDSAAETPCAGTTVALADLADGPHTCAVWVENEDGLVSAPKRVTFAVNSKENEVGWSIAPMDSTGTGFRSSGTTVFANGYGFSAATVNGVEFGVSQYLPSADKVSFSPSQAGSDGWGANNPIFAGGWYWNKTAGASADLTATFKGLTTGHKYAAQMLVSYCRLDSTKVTSVSAGELASVTVSENGDYKYGAIVTRVFVASGTTEDVKVSLAGGNTMFLLKAVQLRDLGEGGEEDPTHEDDPVDPPAGSAWIPDPVQGSNPNSAPCTPNDGGQGGSGQHAIDKKNCQGKNFDLVMLGDSVTENWGSTGVEAANSKLKIDSSSDGVFSIGIGGNRTQHMIWRCQDGALGGDTPETGYTTKYFTLLAGVNNVYQKIIDEGGNPDNPEDIAEAIRTLINMIVAKHPESKILLMPILPYAVRYEKNGNYLANHLKGIRVRETTEDVNDIIIRFVDNKRIFWVDVRKDFVLADGLPNFELFGGPSGTYDPDQCLHPRTTGYDFFNTAVKAAMEKYLNVAAGTAQVSDPSLGLVTYSQNGFDAVATISLSGIYLGTDANAVPVTSYSVAYELDGGAKSNVLSNATATRNSFTIADVAPGVHTVKVTVTTADGKVITRELTFTKCDGWVAEALPTDDGKIYKNGELKYAYALDAYTVNGVQFAKVSGSIDNDNMTAKFGSEGGGGAPTGVANGDYLSMLKKCWWANAGKHTVTLKQLTPGHNYLVQIIACRILDSMDGRVWIDEAFHESYRNAYTVKVRGDEYPCGGSLTGVFTADTTGTKTFSVVSDGNHAVNAIQVRDLGDSGVIPVGPVDPVDPVDPLPVYTLTIPARDHLAVASVKTNNVAVTGSGNDYSIVSNTQVTIAFSATSGYQITGGNPVVVTVESNMTLAQFPTVQQASTPDTPVWPDYVPCTPSNRYTIEGAIPVVNQLYNEQLNSLNDARFPLPREFDLVTIGDSITDNWDTRDKDNYFALAGENGAVFNLGIGGDRIEQLLWRLEEGGCNNFKAKYITLLIGTNNSYQRRMEQNVDPDKPEEMAKGIERVLWDLKTGHPEAKILLMPILPYDKLHDERGAVCRANNENVNDLIINFVDNKQVFWLDIRGGFLNADGSFHDDYWSASGESGSDGKGHYLHPSSKGYSEVFDPAVRAAMKKIASDVSADTAQVTDPTLGYASASVDSWNAQVTMTLSGVYVGTDSSAVKASSYKIEYRLDDGEWTTALENQTLTRNSFVIENVAIGQHTCEIKVTTSAGKSVTTVSEFVMSDAWMAEALGATSASVRTEGELVYAYAADGNYTVAGVAFTKASGSVDDSNIKWPFSATGGSGAPAGVESGGYCDLLTHCWWTNPGTGGKQETITLKGLTPGNEYLVQLFSYRSAYNEGLVYVVGTQADTTFIRAGGDGWPYGGTLVGKFTADATTKDIVIQIEGATALNGIQVRDLGSGEPIPVNPSIGSVSASVSGSTATISLKNIVKGTDDDAVAATSYSVAYTLNGAAAVTALSNQSAATAQFDISNLADGDYTCSVTITTDKGKTSAAKSVNFTIKTSTPGGDDDPDEPMESGWTAEPMDSAGAKFSTKGTFKYAYATQGVTVNGISFTRQITLVDTDSIAFSPADYSFGGVFMNEGVSGDFGLLLGNGWYWKEDGVNARTVTLTLKNLTSGKKYLVQVLSHTMWNDDLVVSVGGCTPQHVHGSDEASGKYGALLTGVFTASAATQAVSISFANSGGEHPINAVQVRELGEGGDDPVTTVSPSIGSLTASVNGTVVTISLADIVFGTDDEGSAATSCSVYYSVTNSNGSEIKSGTVKNGLSAQTYAFDLDDFEAGDYTCGVRITTDKGKTASKTVGFTVEATTPGGDDDPEEPLPVYTLTIPAQDHLSVASVKTNNVAVTGSEGAYSIVSNTQVTITFDAATGYQITAGNPVVVTVESDMTLAEFPTVQEKQGGDDPVVPPGYELGWTASAMTSDPASVRKDGTLLYAYARFDATVNTVEFKGVGSSALAIDNDDVSWTGFNMTVASGSYPDVTDDYLTLLKSSWACMHTYTHSVTLKNLTIGKTYLVQFIGCRSDNSNDAEIYVGETEDTSIFMKAGGTGWPYGGTLVGIFQADAETKVVDLKFTKSSQDWTSWNAVQVRELGAVGPTPADAPIIGGEGVDVPMAVSSDKVSITISNAAVGHTYGYRKSVTLEGLATAEVIKLDAPAATAGVLTLDIPKDPAEPSCFYQIVVE